MSPNHAHMLEASAPGDAISLRLSLQTYGWRRANMTAVFWAYHWGQNYYIAFFSREKRAETQTWSPDIFRWGGGLPREGVGGPKSSVCPSKPGKLKLFWRDIPGFCRDIPGAAEKFEKKKFVLNSRPLFFWFWEFFSAMITGNFTA